MPRPLVSISLQLQHADTLIGSVSSSGCRKQQSSFAGLACGRIVDVVLLTGSDPFVPLGFVKLDYCSSSNRSGNLKEVRS
jgi:hypothetical protein